MIRVSDRANRIKKNCSQNKGFTLVELIIVIAILAILCGLSAVGILSWQDWATFKKENEYAKTLFVAAQNQLTEYVANERIIELQEDLLEENGVDADGYVIYKTKDGINSVNIETLTADENLANLWASTDGRSDIIVSLTAKAGDYQTYLSSPESVGRDTYWLFELLGSYVYDTAILNEGAITVEFTPEDGQVFAVLYTDKHSSFTDGGYNTNDRTEANRRPNMIGYYGVDSLSKATKNTLVKDKINVHKVRLYNKETLYLTFIVDELNSSLNSNETSYTINLLSKDKEEGKTEREKLLTISFSGPLKKEQKPVNANEIDAKVTCYSLSSNNTKDMKILAWQEESDDTVHIVLDAADIAADAYTYNTGYDNIVYGTEDSTVPARTFCADDFRTTYSFFRFGLEVQDIYAQVAVTNDNYKPSNYVDNTIAQGAKNTVFAGVDGNEYSIRNARHLYNIRYMEVANAYADRNNPATGVVGAGITFKINDDINWEDFQRKSVDGKLSGYLYDSSCDIDNPTKINVSNSLVGKKTEITTKEKAVYYCDFPSIPAIRSKDTMDGNGKTITGINVSKEENQVFKAYTILDGSSAKDGTIKPTGFIDINYGTIKNLKMDKLSVSGEDYVGGFVGVNAGKLEKLTLDNTLDDKKKDTSIIKGKKNVGGIVGLVLATNDNDKLVANYKAYDNEGNAVSGEKFLVLSELENNARVEGATAVGGIVGSLRNEFTFIISNLSDLDGLEDSDKTFIQGLIQAGTAQFNIATYKCENYGPILADEDEDDCRYLGGIVGYTYNKDKDNTYRISVTECKSSPQYDADTINNMITEAKKENTGLKGIYVGGISGYNCYGQINACSTTPKNVQSGYVFGYKYVGGIVGFNIGPIRGKVGTIEAVSINRNNVVAYEYAGGITGCNAPISKEDDKGNLISSCDPEILETSILVPATNVDLSAKLDKWVNKGIVVAIHEYAGGITGYNTGWLFGCNSEVTEAMTDEGIAGLYSGAYVGGIAGYNNGVIGNTTRTIAADDKSKSTKGTSDGTLETTCFVRGTDYVGGIVGYNDTKSIIEDYKVIGGHVVGDSEGYYTGGFVGFNGAVDLIMDIETQEARTVLCNPSEVEGGYFAGGIIGGNILNTNGLEVNDEYETQEIVSEITAANKVYDTADVYGELNYSGNNSGNITVYNKTDKDIYSWRVLVKPDPITGDYPQLNFYNDLWDSETHCVRPNNNNALIIKAHDSVELGFGTPSTETDVMKRIKDANKNMQVRYFDRDDNIAGTYWGMAKSASDLGFSMQTYESGEGWYNGVKYADLGRYQLHIENTKSHIMPNWRLELMIPEGTQVFKCTVTTNGKDCTSGYTLDGTNMIFKGNSSSTDYMDNHNHVYIALDLVFASKESREKFEAQTPIVTSNNVVYKYPESMKDSFNFTTGGSTSGGSSSSTSITTTFKKIAANYQTDNFLGKLEGKAFVGGYIGYNCIIDNASTADDEFIKTSNYPDKNATYILQRYIYDEFEKVDENPDKATYEQLLAQKKDILDSLVETTKVTVIDTKAKDSKKFGMFITGIAADGSKKAQTITGDIYVGGVIGYNDDNAPLYIKDVANATPVVAKKAIEYLKEQPVYQGDEIQKDASDKVVYRKTDYSDRSYIYTYSYAGGIIGRVARETTIDNCCNTNTGSVTASGTYTGGICEINEGTIKNCTVPVFGQENQEYLGGLCGLNKHTGVIEDCAFANTISGMNMVGAIASENFGTIRLITFTNPKMDVKSKTYDSDKDGVAGLYAAYNEGTIEVGDKGDFAVEIKSEGRYVGTIVGINAGTILNKKNGANTATGKDTRAAALTLTGSVSGDKTVGGFVGLNKSADTFNYLLNKAIITATNGDAGGIIGENVKAGSRIEYCYNEATVTASDSGNAGGITASNAGTIEYCNDYVVISATNGMCGGIVAQNKNGGSIVNNMVTPLDEAATLTFTSSSAIGAIAAQNDGTIGNNTVQRIILTNTSAYASIGIIVGDNLTNGKIIIPNDVMMGINNSKAEVNADACNVGGIAGTNAGSIYSEATEVRSLPRLSNIDIELKNEGYYASIGGIAGKNTGTIKNIAVDATLQGYQGAADYGYGGIVGANESGTVENCSFDGSINATGSNGTEVNIGGIAGYNGATAIIDKCYVGTRNDSDETNITCGDQSAASDDAVMACIGGIVGNNLGTVKDSDNGSSTNYVVGTASDNSIDNVYIKAFGGYIGGIVGKNNAGAKVSGANAVHISTGKLWNVSALSSTKPQYVGGIIGYSESSDGLSYADNCAHIKTTGSSNVNCVTGGIVGYIKQSGDISLTYLRNCEDIASYGITGGIVGQIDGGSVYMTNSSNHGDITNEYNALSGLIGCYSNPSNAGIYAIACNSFGNITRNLTNNTDDLYVGGFIGRTGGATDDTSIKFGDCVNFGIIKASGASGLSTAAKAGIGSYFGNVDGTIKLDLCQNYNTYTVADTDSISYAAEKFNGSSTTIAMKDCLDDTGNTNISLIKTSITRIDDKGTLYYISEDILGYTADNFVIKLMTNNKNVYRDPINYFTMSKYDPDKIFGDHDSYGKDLIINYTIGNKLNRMNVYLDLSNSFKHNYLGKEAGYIPNFGEGSSRSMMLMSSYYDEPEAYERDSELIEDNESLEDDELKMEVEDAPAITPDPEAGEGTSEVTPQPTPDPTPEVTPEPTSTPEGEGVGPTPEATPDAA